MGATQLRTPNPPLHDASVDFLVCVLDASEILTEAILVELLARRRVPQAAGVGRNLVAEVQLAAMASELELEVHEEQAALLQVGPQHAVDPERHALEPGDFLRRGQ